MPAPALDAALMAAEGRGQRGGSGVAWASLGFAPVTNVNDNAPCNTLFIGNLCNEIDEGDLRAVFEPQPGFRCGRPLAGCTMARACPVHPPANACLPAFKVDLRPVQHPLLKTCARAPFPFSSNPLAFPSHQCCPRQHMPALVNTAAGSCS